MWNRKKNVGRTVIILIIFCPVYKGDDSSDELSDVLDELLMPASDTEENWNLDDDDDDEEGSEEEEDSDDDIKMVNGNDDSDGESSMESE